MARFSAFTLVSLLVLTATSYAVHPLVDVLESRSDLSQFTALLSQYPDLVRLVSAEGTILAPDDNAMQAFTDGLGPDGLASVPADTVSALLRYHLLTSVTDREALSVQGGAIAETALRGDALANLGEQANVVFGSAYGTTGLDDEASNLRIYSGAGDPAEVADSSMRYDGGIIHVIDSVLNLPRNSSATAQAEGLTTFVEVLRRADLINEYDTNPLLTICAPTNEAWDDLGVDLTSLSSAQLRDMLNYHVAGNVTGYTTVLGEDQNVPVLNGQTVRIVKRDGKIMVNDAEILTANVITSNGLVHVVSRVLVPPNSTYTTISPTGSATRTTRRPGDPTPSSFGSEQSGDSTGDGAQDLRTGLLSLLGAVGAAVLVSL